MDPLVLGIIGLLVALILTVALLVVYTGLFEKVEVKSGKPHIGNVRVAYKYAKGPYSECGAVFTEIVCLAPNVRTIGIYYDDPRKVASAELRYIVGAILAEGDSEVDKESEVKLLAKNYKVASFPAVDHAVTTSFPYIWALSIYIATSKVWPKLGEYIEERKLCAHPAIEIYSGDEIQYMLPLSKQEDFYVEEAKKAKDETSSPADQTHEGDITVNEESMSQDTTVSSSGSEGSSGSESSFEELSMQGELEGESLQM
ncbi:testis-expressed protein 264-like [Diadema antillarum]|uniref:testis-expressed protein 264-like n=1 Tax=Diadema antillarum TaxID=105358 RepID=UPI003A8B701B